MILLTPLNFIFSKWKTLVVNIFKLNEENTITKEEIKTIVEEAQVEGGIEAEQSELIQNAIEFNQLCAEDVLTPRVDMIAVDNGSTEDEVGKVFKETGFSRLPVYEDDLDKILGVINQKDFHNYVVGTDKTISDFVKPVVFVASSMKASTLLKMMQREKTHIAIIVDEYGGTEGLVTMEDIIEELVGDIYDEHDAIMSQEISVLQNGSYRVMCNANIAKIFDYLEVEPDGELDVNTVNGWVVLCLDKLPEKGEHGDLGGVEPTGAGVLAQAGAHGHALAPPQPEHQAHACQEEGHFHHEVELRHGGDDPIPEGVQNDRAGQPQWREPQPGQR